MTTSEKKTLNKLLHELVTLRDGSWCLRCKKTERLNLSHIYPKGKYRRLEYDPDNLKFLCFGCHLGWWHKNPIEAHVWLQTVIPKKRLADLKLRAGYTGSVRMDYKLLKLFLENEIRKLKR